MRHKCFIVAGFAVLVLTLATTAAAQRPVLIGMKAQDVTPGNGSSTKASVSADGRFVAFEGGATDLIVSVSGLNIFVRDLKLGTTALVSVNRLGTGAGNRESTNPSISADGRYVAFQSAASDLVPNDTNGREDIFVRDLHAGTTAIASVNQSGVPGNANSFSPFISANGRVVIFQSAASNLSANDANQAEDIFAYDSQVGHAVLVSLNRAGAGAGNKRSMFPTVPGTSQARRGRRFISDDGRFAVFVSHASDLVDIQDSNDVTGSFNDSDVFVRDLVLGVTKLVSVNRAGNGTGDLASADPSISADGGAVAFVSVSRNLVTPDKTFGYTPDVYLRNLVAGTTTLVSVNLSGQYGNSHSDNAVISGDGRHVAFESNASDLVATDTNPGSTFGGGGNVRDIFVRDTQSGVTTLVSINHAGTDSANDLSYEATISSDGRFVAFLSGARNLVSTVTKLNNSSDVFLRDLQTGRTIMQSVTPEGGDTGDNSYVPLVSAGGRIVVFESRSNDLVAGDDNTAHDLFAAATGGVVGFSMNNYTVAETGGAAMITVSRASGAGAQSVYYTTTKGSAASGSDYAAASGTLHFADGETIRTFIVPVSDDVVDEANETVGLLLSNFDDPGAPAVLSGAVLRITDDDAPPSISVADASVVEGDDGTTSAVFTVTLSAASEQRVTVDVSATGVTATLTHLGDLQNPAAKFSIPAGSISQNLVVLVNGDRMFEDDETFLLNLSNPVNATIADGQATGTITNDDPVPSISIANVAVTEGNAGARVALFNVSLSNPTSRQVTFRYATADGTATGGVDYDPAAGSASLAPGTSNTSIAVNIHPDTANEPNETFFVNLSDPTNATISDGEGQGTIVNDDAPVVQFGAATYTAGEGAGRAVLNVVRTGDISAPTSVTIQTVDDPAPVPCATVNGKAYARCDYATTIETVTWAAGDSQPKEVAVPLIDDSRPEGAETLQLWLVSLQGGIYGVRGTATLTITDNETAHGVNPIYTTAFFVRQQYLDFLSREPEEAEPWSDVLNKCSDINSNPACDRLLVSASFFGSPEFRLKGFYVFNFYRVAFNRRPTYEEIIPDMRRVSGATAEEVYQKRAAYPVNFTGRLEFRGRYDALGDAAFVNTLLDRYGLESITAPDPANPEGGTRVVLARDALINRLGASGAQSLTRAQVLRAVVESNEVGAAEYNQAFVAMQYYGYLRRTPEEDGYQSWLRVINQDPNNVRIMVDGFMNSAEYRLRFGQP
ncbi:MAG TPA: Calx-beta domain-containing protein [Pyrinomonadaceae bacterium]|nr:Calx-beta domain-containing protein [Pyrinomonadaceae bacterium]